MSHTLCKETYISVDVETAGPNPGAYSLLSIGACTLDKPQKTFYCELKPTTRNFLAEAKKIHHLSLDELADIGLDPAEAMQRFEAWLSEVTPEGHITVFVAFNAAFDWMFVNEYFHRYLGYNPFGHTALDIKSYYMGLTGTTWQETSKAYLGALYLDRQAFTHNALQDALDQGRIFTKMLAQKRIGEKR